MSSGPGKHWFVVLKNSQNVTEVFNSLGTNHTFLLETFSFHTFYEFNTTPVQSRESILCGQFCIYFIVNRLFDLDAEFEDVINELFEANCEDNEGTVKTFMDSLHSENDRS